MGLQYPTHIANKNVHQEIMPGAPVIDTVGIFQRILSHIQGAFENTPLLEIDPCSCPFKRDMGFDFRNFTIFPKVFRP